MRHRIDDPLPLRDLAERVHGDARRVAGGGARRPARRRQLRDGVVGGERDRAIEALARRIEVHHHLLDRAGEFAHERAQFVGRKALGASLERLVGAAERDHQPALGEQRAQAKGGAEVGLDLVDGRAVRPARHRVDRARRTPEQVVHRGAAGLVALVRGARVAGEEAADLARRADHREQLAVGEAERLQLAHRRRGGNRLVGARQVEGRQVDPGRLHAAEQLAAPTVDEGADQRLAAADPLRDARRVDAEAPRALDQPADLLARAAPCRRPRAERAQQQQAHALVRAVAALCELLRREVERGAALEQRPRLVEQRRPFVGVEAAEAARPRELRRMIGREALEAGAVDLDPLLAVIEHPVGAESRAAPALERLRGDADLAREFFGRRGAAGPLVGTHGDPRGELEHQRGEVGAQRASGDDLTRGRRDLGAEDALQRVAERVVGARVDGRDQVLGRLDLPPRRRLRGVHRLRGKRLDGGEAVAGASRHGRKGLGRR